MWAAVENLVGSVVDLETTDGCSRSGKLTGLTWRSVLVQGAEVRWPMGLVLNGDATDEVPWDRLAWVRTRAGCDARG